MGKAAWRAVKDDDMAGQFLVGPMWPPPITETYLFQDSNLIPDVPMLWHYAMGNSWPGCLRSRLHQLVDFVVEKPLAP